MEEMDINYQTVFENCLDAVIIADPDGRILTANKSACQMFRMSVDELISTGREGLADMSREEMMSKLAERDKDGNLLREFRLIRKGGDVFPAEVSSKIFTSADGIQYNVIVIRDNTEKAETINAHRRMETLLKAVLDNFPMVIFAADMQGRLTFTEGSGFRGTGANPGEDVGKSLYDLYSSVSFTEVDGTKVTGENLFDRLYEGQSIRTLVERKGMIFDNYIGPFMDSNSQQVGIVGLSVNITDRIRASNLIREKEANLRSMIENTDGPIWSLDTNFRLIDCNTNYLQRFRIFFGIDVKKGDNIADPLPDSIRDEWKGYYMRGLSGESFRIQSATHPPLPLEHLRYYFNPIVLESGEIVGVTVAGENITDLVNATNELRTSAENLRALTLHIKDVVENERTTIAHELHDDLGQKLTAINLNLSWLKLKAGDSSQMISDKFDETLEILKDALHSTRRISQGLRPVMLDDLGLVPTIKWQIGEFTKTTGIKCRYLFSPQEIVINSDLALTIFRVIQEALTNAARHSGAKEVILNVEAGSEEIVITLEDNGKGIDSSKINSNMSMGILGMKERVELQNGKINIEGTPGVGTVIKVLFPVG